MAKHIFKNQIQNTKEHPVGVAIDTAIRHGYLINVVKHIGSIVQTKKCMSDIVLIVDVIAQQKPTIWDLKTRKYVDTVDYGAAIPEVEDKLSKKALVSIVSGMSGH